MLELSKVKSFLKVDYPDDDDYIQLITRVAAQYIKNSVGYCDINNPLCELLMYTIIGDLYNRRSYTIDGIDEKVRYTIKSMVQQLSLED